MMKVDYIFLAASLETAKQSGVASLAEEDGRLLLVLYLSWQYQYNWPLYISVKRSDVTGNRFEWELGENKII